MGLPIQRVTDLNSGGGAITQGVDTVFADGLPVAVTGCPVSPHPYYHYGATTIATSTSVFAGGIPVVRTLDTDSCGDARVGGSMDVFVGS